MTIQNQIGNKASYGCIYMNTGNWTGVSFAFTTAYQEMTSLGTNFTLASPSSDFAMTTDGRLKYTGSPTKPFYVDALFQTGSNLGAFAIQVYLNGSSVTGADSYVSGGGIFIVSRAPVLLATDDYLSIFAKKSNNLSIAILQLTLSATFAGGM